MSAIELRVANIQGLSPGFTTKINGHSILSLKSDLRLNNQQYMPMPAGDKAARVSVPLEGSVRWSSDLANFEFYIGRGTTTWSTSAYMIATGGTVATSGIYKTHTFTSTDVFAVGNGGDAEIWVVGGGGGGGGGGANSGSPGGGGGGLVYAKVPFTGGNYAITVGSGGTGGKASSGNSSAAGAGGNSSVTIGGQIFLATGGQGTGAINGNYSSSTNISGGTGTIGGSTSYSYGGTNAVFGTGGYGGHGGDSNSNANAGASGTNFAPGGGGGGTNNGSAANGGNGSSAYFTGGGGGGGRDGDGSNSPAVGYGGSGWYTGGNGANVSSIQATNGGGPVGGSRGDLGSSRWNAGGGGASAGGGGGAAGDSSNSPNASGGQGGGGIVIIKYAYKAAGEDGGSTVAGGSESNPAVSARQAGIDGLTGSIIYMTVHGQVVQMEYDGTDRFGTGDVGWAKMDAATFGANNTIIPYTVYGSPSTIIPAFNTSDNASTSNSTISSGTHRIGREQSHGGGNSLSTIRIGLPKLTKVKYDAQYVSGGQDSADFGSFSQNFNGIIGNNPYENNGSGYWAVIWSGNNGSWNNDMIIIDPGNLTSGNQSHSQDIGPLGFSSETSTDPFVIWGTTDAYREYRYTNSWSIWVH
tara:strand:+ start:3146 stop:5056 length:1911 start_codon:yes stop_codon:yes gene_type:complete